MITEQLKLLVGMQVSRVVPGCTLGSAVPRPAFGVSVAAGHAALRTPWLLWREKEDCSGRAGVTEIEGGMKREREKGREEGERERQGWGWGKGFVKLGFYYPELGKDQESFQINKSTSNLSRLLLVSPPNQSIP